MHYENYFRNPAQQNNLKKKMDKNRRAAIVFMNYWNMWEVFKVNLKGFLYEQIVLIETIKDMFDIKLL